jgi:hypothetical protein
VRFAQPNVNRNVKPGNRRERGGGIASSRQVARHDAIGPQTGEQRSDPTGLIHPDVVEGHISLTLESPFGVPRGTAVAQQDDASATRFFVTGGGPAHP